MRCLGLCFIPCGDFSLRVRHGRRNDQTPALAAADAARLRVDSHPLGGGRERTNAFVDCHVRFKCWFLKVSSSLIQYSENCLCPLLENVLSGNHVAVEVRKTLGRAKISTYFSKGWLSRIKFEGFTHSHSKPTILISVKQVPCFCYREFQIREVLTSISIFRRALTP